jgi:hypothetical protein
MAFPIPRPDPVTRAILFVNDELDIFMSITFRSS